MTQTVYRSAVWGQFPGEDKPRLLPRGQALPGRAPKDMDKVVEKFERITGRPMLELAEASAVTVAANLAQPSKEASTPVKDRFSKMTIHQLRAAAAELKLSPEPTAKAVELRDMLRAAQEAQDGN